MRISKPARHVMKHPVDFVLQTLRGFSKNQGMLLAGALAYYALLSALPLLILSIIALSHFVDQAELLNTVGRYLEWLVPSQSQAVLIDVSGFLENQVSNSVVLFVTMIFFSSLAFSALEKAIAVIFHHHGIVKKRHFIISAILPYCFAFLLGVALLAVTLTTVILQAMALESVHLFGHFWSLRGVSGMLLYLLGFFMGALILSVLYLVLPVGRIRLHHAFIGGFVATSLWEVIRHILFWYFSRLSKASIVYGSLTTAVVVLFSMEIAAMLLLLGAQVISEYERLGQETS
ncbi:MAG: YihY/virulence factor BrkB family protein [Sulfuricaulis sp.]